MKQTILVTGGTGFIGSHTTVELIEAGYKVVIVDNLSNSTADSIDGIERITGVRPDFEQVDCCAIGWSKVITEASRIVIVLGLKLVRKRTNFFHTKQILNFAA